MSQIRAQLNQKSIRYNSHDSELSVLEGVFARGDRKCSKVLLSAYKKGCMFDSWSEFFDYKKWDEAFEENGIDPLFYTYRKRELDEILPWDFIDIGVTKKFLMKEYEKALDVFLKLTKDYPENMNILFSFAKAAEKSGKIQEAKNAVTRVLEIFDDMPEAKKMLKRIQKLEKQV